MQVDIWSDVVCPWCYIGKRRFEGALARFAHRDEVTVTWHSFELDTSAPPERSGPYAARLAEKYGVSVADAQGMVDSMTATAAGDGLDFRFDLARPGNTFDAHRLLHLAGERGLQDALKERLLAAYMLEGRPVGDLDTLAALAAETGLDPVEARAVLRSDAYAADVRADEMQAAEIGISGVPFFVIDRRYGVSGAQPVELLLEVLERAWADTHAMPALVPVGGPAEGTCEGDGCAV
ncbi:MAG: protein disulfide isomerase FrnE [Mycobacteriales bacterium]